MHQHRYNNGISLFLRLRLLRRSQDLRTWLASCKCFEDGLAIGAFTFQSDSSDLTSSLQQLSHRPGQVIVATRNMHSRDMYSRDMLVPTKHGLTD